MRALRFVAGLALAFFALVSCGTSSKVFLDSANRSLESGNLEAAYSQFAYVIVYGDAEDAMRAITTVRSSEQALNGMRQRLEEVALETFDIAGNRERFIHDYGARYEVKAYFRVRPHSSEEQRLYIEAAWNDAADTRGKGERAKAEAARAKAEADRARAEERARQREAEAQEKETLLKAAVLGRKVKCSSDRECKKAFSLAQIYVNSRSDMKIQLATDTIIETYSTSEPGRIAARVTKTPGAGETAEIEIETTCKDCGWYEQRRSLIVMRDFNAFIQERLKN